MNKITLELMNAYQATDLCSLDSSDMKNCDGLFLSALGARICYSKKSPFDLMFEDKVKNVKDRVKFLNKLATMGHTSVFAHSPFPFESDITYNIYKMWEYVDIADLSKIYYCANGRHLVEAGEKIEHITTNSNLKDIIVTAWNWPIDCEYENNVENIIKENEAGEGYPSHSLASTSRIICFYLTNSKPWHWFSFIVKCSRVCSHQWVRHTWLNFSQRSHRYTEVSNYISPDSVTQNMVYKMLQYSGVIKKEGIEYNIPKEDIRYLLPAGAETTLMASGPLFVWEDFINKRTVEAAQWEIREIAEIIKNAIIYNIEKYGG